MIYVICCGNMILQISFSTWEPGVGRLKLSWPAIVHRGDSVGMSNYQPMEGDVIDALKGGGIV